jgi:hypothetical protein
MPPAIIAAITTYASATIIGGAVAAAAFKLAALAFVTAGLSYLIAKSQARSAFQDQAQGRMIARRDPIAPHRIVYGKLRVGGPVVFMETTSVSNEFIHIVIVLASHEINAVTAVYFDDYELQLDGNGEETGDFAGFARVKVKLGTADQTAFAELVTESNGLWTNNHRLRGRAALYVRLKFSTDKYPNGIPNITAIIEGKKVYDPRSTTTAYSANPALIIADFLKDTAYGLGVPSGEIDETALIAAANICDESIPLDAGGNENRYEAHGSFDSVETPEAILNKLVTSMAGKLLLTNGYWVILAGAYRTPTITLDEDDLRAGIRIQTLQSKNQQFNAIRGVFAAPENLYQPTDFPAIKSATYIAEDSGLETWKDITLPFTTSVTMAQRLAKIDLLRSRQQISLTYPAKLTAFNVQVGDVVYINNTRLGWSSKPFEVVSNTIVLNEEGGALLIGFDLELRETATNVFDWDASEEQPFDAAPNTNLPDVRNVIAPGISASDELRVENETLITTMLVTVTGGGVFRDRYEVEAKLSTDSVFTNLGQASGNQFEFANVTDGATYNIRARTISTLGAVSPYSTFTYTVVGKTSPPSNVANFSVNIIEGDAHLTWDAVPDLDLSHYRIRYSPLLSGATYSNGIDIVQKVSRPATSVVVPALTGTYMIKAYDKLGIPSENARYIVNEVSRSVYQNVVDTIVLDPTFSGSTFNCFVSSGRLKLNLGETTGFYSPDSVFDLGGVYTSKISFKAKVIREDYANQFDDAQGNFDSRAGLFDGEEDEFDDTSVEVYIRTTNEDPATSSNWEPLRPFVAGEYRARGIEFVIFLYSLTTDASPSIEELEFECDMPDRVAYGNDIASGAAAYSVTYSGAFKEPPALAITAQNMGTGDFYTITSKSRTGFTIEFKNSGGTTVSRTFDWVARGYGEQQ